MINKGNSRFTMTEKLKDNSVGAHLREARLTLSRRFLDEVLLGAIQEETLTSPDDVLTLYEAFRRDNAGVGDDFELGHVYFIALERDLYNECLAEQSPEQFPLDAADVAAAVGVLETLISRP